MKSLVEEYKEMFDFVEITGRCGGEVETYRVYKDGTVVQR